jgi:hypothetical protein
LCRIAFHRIDVRNGVGKIRLRGGDALTTKVGKIGDLILEELGYGRGMKDFGTSLRGGTIVEEGSDYLFKNGLQLGKKT